MLTASSTASSLPSLQTSYQVIILLTTETIIVMMTANSARHEAEVLEQAW